MKNSVAQQKGELRRRLLQMRKQLSVSQREQYDLQIAQNLFTIKEYKNCKTLLCYASLPDEVSTDFITQHSCSLGKKIALPKCVPETKQLRFYIVKSWEDLQPGHCRIMEPVPEKCEELTDFAHSICLVPALSIDNRGFRLGYGGGYYDNFLSSYNYTSIGLIYSFMQSDSLVYDVHDRAVDYIVTERGVICTKNY